MTNNLISNLMLDRRMPEPEVGMGGTVCLWSDRYAVTVVEVLGRNQVRVREDLAIRVDGLGMTDAQSYRYEPDPDGRDYVFSRRKNGSWVRQGEPMRQGLKLSLGHRSSYHDYSF